MAVRYFIKYFDIVDIEHRLNIYDDAYVGEAIQVDGNVNVTYSDTDDSLEAIRGQGLRVELEANKDLTFNNLWSENQKTFKVEYKRNDIILFSGWLNPEGFFESFVDTDWIVTFDCVDGLGYLSDLAFVDESGFPITGRKTQIEVLSIALKRTGLYQNINTAIDIRYNGLSDSLDVLNNVYVNTDRYIKDDGETIMSCEDVLRDILEPYCACITSYNGEWYIYKPNQLYNDTNVSFYNYTYLGIYNDVNILDFNNSIGSNWKGFYPHHCSANQTIRNTNSVTAYRINYKYGLAKSLLGNKNLYSSNGTTYDNFTIYSYANLTVPTPNGYGAIIDSVELGSEELVLFSNDINIIEGIKIDFTIKYSVNIDLDISNRNFIYQVSLKNGVNTYYLKNTNEWVLGVPTFLYNGISYNNDSVINTIADPVPIDGDFRISIYTPNYESLTPTTAGNIELTEVSINNINETPTNLKGEFHTVQRISKPSSKIEDIKEVATGDNISDIYEGTLYQSDAQTPTQYWHRKGLEAVDIDKPLLQLMGGETLRMNQLPSRVFSGDVYGYFPYLSVITIDGLDGLFMPIKYDYNTKNNIINAEFKQIFGDELGSDIDYKLTFDYGNTVKPTII